MQLFLAQMREGDKHSREGEKRFGAVPFTDINKKEQRQGLNAGESLQAHPLMQDKPQLDGIDPKSNPDASINPEAAENAQRLQNELHPGMRPGAAATFKRDR